MSDSNIPQDDSEENQNHNPDVDWFRVHRSMYSGQLYGRRDLQALWILLIAEATWKTHKRGVKTYKRGTYYFGLARLAGVLGYASPKSVSSALKELEAFGYVKTQKVDFKSHKQFEVTVCNYSKYQGGTGKNGMEKFHENSFKIPPKFHQNALPKELKKLRTKEFKTKEVPVAPTPGSEIFKIYEEGFKAKFGRAPVRNAKVNSVAKKMAEQLGLEDAKKVVSFYLQSENLFYAQKGYPLELALGDAQAILLHEGKAPPPKTPYNRNAPFSAPIQGPAIPKIVTPTKEQADLLVDKSCTFCQGSGLLKEADEKGRQYRCTRCNAFFLRMLREDNHPLDPGYYDRRKASLDRFKKQFKERLTP